MAITKNKQPLPASDQGRANILAAARDAFANHGFEGAKLRAISAQAGVLHTGMLYHFKSKDTLWRAVVNDLFERFEMRINAQVAGLDDVSSQQAARVLLREFIRFSAQYPQLHRIMTSEGRTQSDRLKWLVETHSMRLYKLVSGFTPFLPIQGGGNTPIRLYYAIVGLATAPFTLAPEFQLLSGIDPFCEAELETTIAFVEALLFR
jgi:TetR/AcrR family transcriptional regulator